VGKKTGKNAVYGKTYNQRREKKERNQLLLSYESRILFLQLLYFLLQLNQVSLHRKKTQTRIIVKQRKKKTRNCGLWLHSITRVEEEEAIFTCFLALDRAADSRFFMSRALRMSLEAGGAILFENGWAKGSVFEAVCSSCRSLCRGRYSEERVLKVRAVTGDGLKGPARKS